MTSMNTKRSRATTGRRPGPDSSRAQVLDAARLSFAAAGYEGTSVRAVATKAGVDPSTVLHFFGSKDGLFRAVISDVVPALDPMVTALRCRADGSELARLYLDMWDSEAGSATRALIRSSIASDQAVHLMRENFAEHILRAVPDLNPLGLELALTHLIGLAIGRYITRLPELCRIDIGTLAVLVGPTLNTYLRMPSTAGGQDSHGAARI
jgi:AcrR family transcriptional regulator